MSKPPFHSRYPRIAGILFGALMALYVVAAMMLMEAASRWFGWHRVIATYSLTCTAAVIIWAIWADLRDRRRGR